MAHNTGDYVEPVVVKTRRGRKKVIGKPSRPPFLDSPKKTPHVATSNVAFSSGQDRKNTTTPSPQKQRATPQRKKGKVKDCIP
jgi:hypothetical protein